MKVKKETRAGVKIVRITISGRHLMQDSEGRSYWAYWTYFIIKNKKGRVGEAKSVVDEYLADIQKNPRAFRENEDELVLLKALQELPKK